MKFKWAAALAAVLVVAGCSTAGGGDKEGARDTVIVGALGNISDSLNPLATQGNADYIGIGHLYKSLVAIADGQSRLELAESIEPNRDATSWTVTLKPGLTFSDGSPIRPEDVVSSLQLLADPAQNMNYGQFYADVDAAKIAVSGEREVTVPLKRARADFVSTVLAMGSYVLKEGATDWAHPVSSGDYALAEYVPGERIVLDARHDVPEPPTLEHVEVRVINDTQARANAVRSGEIDYAFRVDAATARGVADRSGLAVSRGSSASAQVLGFEMNVQKAPFDDPRVREAMRLAIDRQALVDTVLLGEGEVGNDLVGLGLPGYDSSIPQRAHDPARAKQLFADAKVTTLKLRAADTIPGMVDAAELFAAQLGDAGVRVEIDRADPAAFYADFDVLLNTPLQTSYYLNRDAASFIGSFTGSFGYFNISGFNPPGYDDAVKKAQATTDPGARERAFAALQQQQWRDGGMILWGYQPVLSIQTEDVQGVTFRQGLPDFGAASVS